MRTLCLAGLALAAGLSSAAAQSYGWTHYDQRYQPQGYYVNRDCERQRETGQIAGALIGGVIGGALGGAIADDDDDGYRRYHRGYRHHWKARDHWGYHRPYHRRHYYYDDDNDEAVGILLGAVVGGLAGSEIGRRSVDCDPVWQYRDVPPPTRAPYGPGWSDTRPVYGTANQELHGGTEPPPAIQECETVWRETRLPDGRIIREPATACREGEVYYEPRTRYEDWELKPDCGLQTRDPDCIG